MATGFTNAKEFTGEGTELGGESRTTVIAAPRSGFHGAINNAAGLHCSQAPGSFEPPTLKEQEDQEMKDEGGKSLYENNHAMSSRIFEGQRSGEVYRLHPRPLTSFVPTGSGGRDQGTIPTFVDFNSAESVLDADETRRLAGWRSKSSLGAAGLGFGMFERGYTKDYDNYIVTQHVTSADQNGGHQIPLGIPIEQSNLWFADKNEAQESSFLHNNRDKETTSMREGRTRN